jgi:hypothetical protein
VAWQVALVPALALVPAVALVPALALVPVVARVPAPGHEREYARRQTHDYPCVVQKQGQMSWTTLQESQLLVSSIESLTLFAAIRSPTAAQLFCDHVKPLNPLSRTSLRLSVPYNFFRKSYPNVENAPSAPTHLLKAHKPVRKSKGEQHVKYILMMNCPKTGYDTFGAWPKKDIQAHIAFMHALNNALRESGELVSAEA